MGRLSQVIQKLTIMQAMFLVAALPIVLVLAMSAWIALPTLKDARAYAHISKRVDLLAAMTSLVHEQQKERGMTAVFLASEGALFAEELVAQRQATDEMRARVGPLMADARASVAQSEDDAPITPDGAFVQGLGAMEAELALMDGLRAQVDAMEVAADDAVAYYTALNAVTLGLVKQVSHLTHDAELGSSIASLFGFLQGKEYAGIERAVGSRGFAQGRFGGELLSKFTTVMSLQDAFFSVFLADATAEQKDAYAQMLQAKPTQTVAKMRSTAISGGMWGLVDGITGPDFFAAMTQKIDGFKAFEDRLTRDLRQLTDQKNAQSRTSALVAFALVVVAIAAVIAGSYLIARRFQMAMAQLIDTAIEMSEGDLDVELPAADETEIGRISGALDQFRHSILDARAREDELKRQEVEAARQKAEQERAEREEERRAGEAAAKAAAQEREREAEITAEINSVVSACAAGDFSRRLDVAGKDGIFAELCRGVNEIGDAAEAGLHEVQRALDALSQGDLTHVANDRLPGTFGELGALINGSVRGLGGLISEVSTNTLDGATLLNSIEAATRDLARRTESSAATLEQTSSSLGRISASVREVADAVDEVNVNANEVAGRAREGVDIVDQTIDSMRKIQESAQSIAGIVDLIDSIAFQTNLLALNAGVEAARAGEAGRGFSVVATEVRELSGRTTEAARRIAELIAVSGSQVEEGVANVDRSGALLKAIADSVGDISARFGTIAEATRTQTTGLDEISTAATELDETAQANAAMFEETAAAVNNLLDTSRITSDAVRAFKTRDTGADQPGSGVMAAE